MLVFRRIYIAFFFTGVMEWNALWKITRIPILIASLCCVTPLVLVLVGISTVSFAGSLADTLYGDYKWVFRLMGLLALIASLVVYFRNKGICTLDQVRRKRNQVVNMILVALIVAVMGYVVWLYVVVELIGKLVGIWG
ncbi:hypothetical protein EXS73_01230 [Candidatus Pacearchaeota archaeon]|nr:hypothetical protein [Candidatus Pacearchaeota archaeon]